MKNLFITAFCGLLSSVAIAGDIDPAAIEFPWMNGPTPEAVYKLSDHPEKIHIFEAFSIGCSWCNRNAAQVESLAAEYRELADEDKKYERVQFVDLGLDSRPRDYSRWISQHNPSYPVVRDVNKTVWNALRQEDGIPQTFVVNCRGELVGSTVGYWGEPQFRTLRDAIEEALKVECE